MDGLVRLMQDVLPSRNTDPANDLFQKERLKVFAS